LQYYQKINNLFSKYQKYIIEINDISEISEIDSDGNINKILLNLSILNNLTNYNNFSIYFTIFDEDTNSYIDYSTLLNVNSDNNIIKISKHKAIINKFFKQKSKKYLFAIIPLTKEYKNIIIKFEDTLFKTNTYDNNKFKEICKITQFIFDLILYKAIPFITLVVLPLYVYSFLIDDVGLVESLIDITTISNVTIQILLTSIFYIWEYIMYIFIAGIISIPIYILVIFYTAMLCMYFIPIVVKKLLNNLLCENKYDYTSEQIGMFRDKKMLKNEILSMFSYKFIYRYSLGFLVSVFTLFLIFLLSQINIQNKDIQNKNIVEIVSNYYLSQSAFPQLAKITQSNDKNKVVLIMGYDKIFTYYYSISTIERIINDKNHIKEYFDKNKNIKSIEFDKLFKKYIIGKIKNSDIKFIKNNDYKIIPLNNTLYLNKNIIVKGNNISIVYQ